MMTMQETVSISRPYLFPVGGDDANVGGIHRVVELFCQLAAVQHNLYSLRWVEP